MTETSNIHAKLVAMKQKTIPPVPKLKEIDGIKDNKQLNNIKDQYVKNIKFGVRSIDTNIDLKRFILKQNDKKVLNQDQTEKDIKIFFQNFCRHKNDGHEH